MREGIVVLGAGVDLYEGSLVCFVGLWVMRREHRSLAVAAQNWPQVGDE